MQAHLSLSTSHIPYIMIFLTSNKSWSLLPHSPFIFCSLFLSRSSLSTLGFLFLFSGFEEHTEVKNSNNTKKKKTWKETTTKIPPKRISINILRLILSNSKLVLSHTLVLNSNTAFPKEDSSSLSHHSVYFLHYTCLLIGLSSFICPVPIECKLHEGRDLVTTFSFNH